MSFVIELSSLQRAAPSARAATRFEADLSGLSPPTRSKPCPTTSPIVSEAHGRKALSHCHAASAKCRRLRNYQAAATAVRHVDGEPHAWPRMKDLRLGEELVGQFRHPRPYQSRSLTASAQPPMPEHNDMISECGQRQAVGRHGVVGEVTGDDLTKPFSRFGDRPVRALSKRLLDFPELRFHAIPARLPPDSEVATTSLVANEHEAKEREGLRFGEPALLAVLRREAAELNQAGLVRMKRQRELLSACRASPPRSGERRSHAG